MKFSAVFFALVAVAAALPTQEAADSTSTTTEAARRRLEISFCRRANFEDCDIISTAEKRICNSVPAVLNDRIKSISFHGANQCTFYDDLSCAGRSFTDSGSVPEVSRRFRNRISSYRCD